MRETKIVELDENERKGEKPPKGKETAPNNDINNIDTDKGQKPFTGS